MSGPSQELHLQPHRSTDPNVVVDLRGDRLFVTGMKAPFDGGAGGDREFDRAAQHVKEAPGAGWNPVIPAQARWDRVLGERTRHPDHAETLGELGAVAEGAVELGADPSGPPGVGAHPRPELERRTMAHMLGVQAVQFGNPVAFVISVKTGDLSPHC